MKNAVIAAVVPAGVAADLRYERYPALGGADDDGGWHLAGLFCVYEDAFERDDTLEQA